ncbi:hypothetical protein Scep_029025 [Stephania cephalantha]|uniref:Steroid nuclear receptor ligand-binding n=1 Tax=Stephania cephalantha TaxID=152367 RepID=A0AAP0EF84_9MAGN
MKARAVARPCSSLSSTSNSPFFTLADTFTTLNTFGGFAAIIGPIAVVIVLIGNSAVIIGLWPAHFIWTYYCIAKTKRLGLVSKTLLLVCFPLPLALWPILAIAGSLLVGIGYGIFTPVVATFEASGRQLGDKLFHYFLLASNHTGMPGNLDLAVPVDVLLITTVALYKSPYMLFKGWKRLIEDLIGREGPFLETVCVPFAGLAIILWPIVVLAAVITSFICSFFLGFYGAAIVHQETSFRMGLAYIVAVVSLFDEYTNDLLYLREGSCLPRMTVATLMTVRPSYRRNKGTHNEIFGKTSLDGSVRNQESRRGGLNMLVSERSRTLKWAIQQLKPMQVWDWLFRSCEMNGRLLMHEGLIDVKDIEECILKGKCKKLGIKLPAWCILQSLLKSARSNTDGLLITDDMEVTTFNGPRDKVFEWFIGPLLIMKEQIKRLHLDETEETCLKVLIMSYDNEKPEDWDGKFPSQDKVRRAQLQAILRRLHGIVASMTRIPTFRRRFKNLVNVLYLETGALSNQEEGSLKSQKSDDSEMRSDGNASTSIGRERRDDECDNIV